MAMWEGKPKGLAEDDLREIERRWLTQYHDRELERQGMTTDEILDFAVNNIHMLLAEVRRLRGFPSS
jgi:hypothetical protein